MAKPLLKALDWGTKVGGGNFVTYYFSGSGETLFTPFNEDVQSAGFVAYEKAQFKLAFNIYSSFINLHFLQVNASGKADFNLLTFGSNSGILGAMSPPGTGRSSGTGAFNFAGAGWDFQSPGTGGLEQGGYGFITIIHELGHGLGLAHPHDHGGGSTVFPDVDSPGDLGKYDLNQGVYTVMSYNDGWQTNPNGKPPTPGSYGFQGTPMALDIAILQQKYGANDAYHTGDNTYVLPKANKVGTFFSCIWDAGGKDGIVYDGGRPALIDLRAATLKVEPGGGGFLSHADKIFGGFTIAHRVVIENARGGKGDDAIIGNAASNELVGGAGKDLLQGRLGNDRLFGGRGADDLAGHAGRDQLSGGPGNDILSGGAGSDRFIFDTALGSVDTIVDFKPGTDEIWLAKGVFAGLGGKGVLAAKLFHVGATAGDANDRIIYDGATGALSYDANGNKGGGGVQFALLGGGLDVTHRDFIVFA